MAGQVHVERRPDGVAHVRLDNPPLNALSRALLDDLGHAFTSLAADGGVKAAVVSGNDKALAAGADISEFGGRDEAVALGSAFRHAFDAIGSLPRPVIAAITGYALGGGLELAMACDLRVAADTARLGQPEILLGIIPGAGGTQRLPRLVGPARAKELVWSGRQVRADEALAIGLVDKVVPAVDCVDAALQWAASFARGAVVAMGLAKQAIDRGLDGSLSAGLDEESLRFADVFATEDAATGIASFRENGPGKARFAGR
jgi:enoyl-CoA hydratase/carnithine racemase